MKTLVKRAVGFARKRSASGLSTNCIAFVLMDLPVHELIETLQGLIDIYVESF